MSPKSTTDLSNPIIVVDGQILDGYHRSYEKYINDDFMMSAYVAI